METRGARRTHDDTVVGGRGRGTLPPPPPEDPPAPAPRPFKLSEYVDPKEEKAYAAVCSQLAFKPERGDAAIAFKLRAQAVLARIPTEGHLRVLIRAVSETDAGTKWLHGLHTQNTYPTTLEQFWEHFEHEFLPMDPATNAYCRLFSVRQSYMSASAYVDSFRDAVSNLYAIGAPPMSDEGLAHYFLYRASPELRHAVRMHMVGSAYTLAAVLATAVHVGAESRRPAARATAVSPKPKECYNCGKKGHIARDCIHKDKKKPAAKSEKKESEPAEPEGAKPKGSPK